MTHTKYYAANVAAATGFIYLYHLSYLTTENK